jgi:hypothetical protein
MLHLFLTCGADAEQMIRIRIVSMRKQEAGTPSTTWNQASRSHRKRRQSTRSVTCGNFIIYFPNFCETTAKVHAENMSNTISDRPFMKDMTSVDRTSDARLSLRNVEDKVSELDLSFDAPVGI